MSEIDKLKKRQNTFLVGGLLFFLMGIGFGLLLGSIPEVDCFEIYTGLEDQLGCQEVNQSAFQFTFLWVLGWGAIGAIFMSVGLWYRSKLESLKQGKVASKPARRGTSDLESRLAGLDSLRERGVLTEDEYQIRRRKVIEGD